MKSIKKTQKQEKKHDRSNNKSSRLHATSKQKDKTSKNLSEEASIITSQIYASALFNQASKHEKIRIKKWMVLIAKPCDSLLEEQNRLNHLRLLQLMCENGILVFPYTTIPLSSTLPILQKYEINRILDEMQGKAKTTNDQTKQFHCQTQFPKTKCSEWTSKIYREKQRAPEIIDDEQSQEEIAIKTIKVNDLGTLSESNNINDFQSRTEHVERTTYKQNLDSIKSFQKQKEFQFIKNTILNANRQASIVQSQQYQNKTDEAEDTPSLNASRQLAYRNTLSDSINLEVYPHSISEKIRRYTSQRMKTTKDTTRQTGKEISYILTNPNQDLPSKRDLKDAGHFPYHSSNNQPSEMSQIFEVRKPISWISLHHLTQNGSYSSGIDLKNFQTRQIEKEACCGCFNFAKKDDRVIFIN